MLYEWRRSLLAQWLLFSLRHIVADPGSPVPGEASPPEALDHYGSPYRPQIHWSPPVGFMNDPNGLFIDAFGVWHLYYQYNPTGLSVGNQHWGHAVSRDLYHWIPQKNAISPEGSGLIFSGSAVRDVNNTSGLFPIGNGSNNVLAFYTSALSTSQTQDIAYSDDDGYTFTKYPGNPVLDYHNPDFRDPKVFWHYPTSKWVMTIAFAVERIVAFFTSSDAIHWTPTSNFSIAGEEGVVYECPNLVEVPLLRDGYAEDKFNKNNVDGTAWLLLFSIVAIPPLGDSINQYIPGSFNGTHFEPFDEEVRLTDWCRDNYAAQFWDGIPSDQGQVMITWASNWQYTNEVPTDIAGFRGVFGLPRLTGLAHTYSSKWTLISGPYPFPSDLLTSLDPSASAVNNNNLAASTATTQNITNTTRYIDIVSASVLPSSALSLKLKVTSLSDQTQGGSMHFVLQATSTSESLQGGYILGCNNNNNIGTVWLDRSGMKGYSSAHFTGQFSQSYAQDPDRGIVELLVVIDRGIVEIFLDGGIGPSGTAVWFQSPEAISGGGVDMLSLTSSINGEGMVQAEIQGLNSIWHD